MTDDIVERLRAEAAAHSDGDRSDQVIRRRFSAAADEIERLRAENEALRFSLTDLVADFASTEATHEDVYYVWEQIVRRSHGLVADVIRDVSDHDEGWRWDLQLPKEAAATPKENDR